ncbi:acetate/propionate family kinase [Candidatus Peregrinibacteria bacterium]|nr:acetate/propionate family kinase [Candidatus Peregrinibacteria bacterium]
MKTITINPGSTSVKYTLFHGDSKSAFCHFKKIRGKYRMNGARIKERDFLDSFRFFRGYLKGKGLLKNSQEITKIGIRIVHGGNYFSEPIILNRSVIKKIKKLSELAPLHNPFALSIISQVQKKLPKVPITAVFDTAFHQTIPEYASTYAIPTSVSDKYGIKRYGFHGIACQWALRQIARKYKQIPKNIVICHLGGGASITAVKSGKSIDTSMGFTPLEGLMMVSRSGDIGAGVVEYLSEKKPVQKVIDMLNEESGFYGITGSKDIEKVVNKAVKGNKKCKLALEMFCYRLVKYIYSYCGAMQGLDLVVFSGGMGEGSSIIRNIVTKELKPLGITSKQVMVVHTDEAQEIFENIKLA